MSEEKYDWSKNECAECGRIHWGKEKHAFVDRYAKKEEPVEPESIK